MTFGYSEQMWTMGGQYAPTTATASPVASQAILFSAADDGDDRALLPTGVKNLITEASDFTIRLKFQAGSSSASEAIMAVTHASTNRIAIELAASDLRCRVYDGAAGAKSKSRALSTRDAIHTLIMTFDADKAGGGPGAVGEVTAWLDGTEMTGTNGAAVSGTSGGYLGAHSTGDDYGSIETFTGTIWAFEIYNSTITAADGLDALTATRKFSFIEKTSTTAEDEQDSGDEITLQNGATFAEIPT